VCEFLGGSLPYAPFEFVLAVLRFRSEAVVFLPGSRACGSAARARVNFRSHSLSAHSQQQTGFPF
jgi:hypothetical protein